MKRQVLYRQCRLEKQTQRGSKHLVTWLPQKVAKLRNVLRLKDDAGQWMDGWQVMVVGTRSQSSVQLDKHYRASLKLS
ncbi:MAG: hypothetical protein P1V97_39205 [Planctomycetota bacterium]|nr:hypothetical protein [Planctomycetota bacterium]